MASLSCVEPTLSSVCWKVYRPVCVVCVSLVCVCVLGEEEEEYWRNALADMNKGRRPQKKSFNKGIYNTRQ